MIFIFIAIFVGVEKTLSVADLMIDYSIDYCTLGVMYWSQEIAEKVSHNKFLLSKLDVDPVREDNHLDCNGDVHLRASSVDELLPYLQYLRSRGVSAKELRQSEI